MNTLIIEALATAEPVQVGRGIRVLVIVTLVFGIPSIWIALLLKKRPRNW